jgi:AcrR family transcriptional regulator
MTVARKKIEGGRVNQKQRTRTEILRAAERLLARGEQPGLEAVAEEALVSRATVYRYFSNLDMLLAEAPLDVQTLDAEELLGDMPPDRASDPAERAVRIHEHLHDLVCRNESRFRLFLKATLEQWIAEGGNPKEPLRGARRIRMLDLALDPLRRKLDRKTYKNLRSSLALLVSVEAYIAQTDVCRLNPKQGKAVASWAIRTLVSAVTSEARGR